MSADVYRLGRFLAAVLVNADTPGGVSIRALAKACEISERTARRYASVVELCNWPVERRGGRLVWFGPLEAPDVREVAD